MAATRGTPTPAPMPMPALVLVLKPLGDVRAVSGTLSVTVALVTNADAEAVVEVAAIDEVVEVPLPAVRLK